MPTALPDLPPFDSIVQHVSHDTILGSSVGKVLGFGRKGAKFGISEHADPQAIPPALPEDEHEGVTVFVQFARPANEPNVLRTEIGDYELGPEWRKPIVVAMKAEELRVVSSGAAA